MISAAELEFGGFTFSFSTMATSPSHRWWLQNASRGTWESDLVSLLLDTVKPGDLFFDLGAWIGPYTLLASRLVLDSGHVYAFEPDPVAHSLLMKNIEANRCSNVTVSNAAVSDADETLWLVPGKHFGDSNAMVSAVARTGSITVCGTSLNSFCSRMSLSPDVVKIDVEGAEDSIVSGSGDVLRSARLVIIEVHHSFLSHRGIDPSHFIETAERATNKKAVRIRETEFTTLVSFFR